MKLDEMKTGESATIFEVNCEKPLRHRLLDMGLTPKTKIMVRKVAPMGDPIEVCLRGYELTLRKADANKILVKGVHPCLLK
ncbi:MAG: ferrous iron transport protein A [Clostridiales bacterium]